MSSGAHILTCVIIKILESKGLNLKLPLALVLNYPALDFNFASWMSKDHLKVLRAEDTSGYLSSGGRIDDKRVSEHEDYMHFNTLSMVGSDGRESRLRRSSSTTAGARRNRSWVTTFKGFAVGDRSDGRHSPVAEGAHSPRKLRLRRSTPSFKGSNNGVVTAPNQILGFTPRETGSKPSRPRAQSGPGELPEARSSAATTGGCGKLSADGGGGKRTDSGDLKKSTPAHIHFSETGKGDPFGDQDDENHKASIGRGRLTMTSRTGYFQDRVIPPSMVIILPAFTSARVRISDGPRPRCARWLSYTFRTGTQISARITRCHQS